MFYIVFYKSEKTCFLKVFYLQINVFNIYVSHHMVNPSLYDLVKYKCKQKLTIITKI